MTWTLVKWHGQRLVSATSNLVCTLQKDVARSTFSQPATSQYLYEFAQRSGFVFRHLPVAENVFSFVQKVLFTFSQAFFPLLGVWVGNQVREGRSSRLKEGSLYGPGTKGRKEDPYWSIWSEELAALPSSRHTMFLPSEVAWHLLETLASAFIIAASLWQETKLSHTYVIVLYSTKVLQLLCLSDTVVVCQASPDNSILVFKGILRVEWASNSQLQREHFMEKGFSFKYRNSACEWPFWWVHLR